jgi:hypothetical protein
MFEASETTKSETSESEALVSETLEFRDRGCESIRITCDVILSIQFKCRAPGNSKSDILSTRVQNSSANNQILS